MDCKLCGDKNIQASMGGPDICPACDSYPPEIRKVQIQYGKELEAERQLRKEVEKENKTLKVEKEMLQKMLRVSQQQNLELIEGMENVKADFENGRMR